MMNIYICYGLDSVETKCKLCIEPPFACGTCPCNVKANSIKVKTENWDEKGKEFVLNKCKKGKEIILFVL